MSSRGEQLSPSLLQAVAPSGNHPAATSDSSELSLPESPIADAHADMLRMLPSAHIGGQPTHTVFNQSIPLSGYNAYCCDPAFTEGVRAHDGEWGASKLEDLGAKIGSVLWQTRASDANRHVPRLESHDRFGNRRDAAEYHPAYHQLMELGLESGAAAFAWRPENRNQPGAHVVRGALMYLMYQLDPGVCCPITMTFAATPALERQRLEHDRTQYVSNLVKKLATGSYISADIPIEGKSGVTMGMSMTEKQGGSDVRANTTEATPVVPGAGGPGDAFTLVGHKWFTSAPMSDAFLTLAQTREGVSCFVVPRWLPDGTRNSGFIVQRLKDKLGDKSNASSEVEYRNAWGVMIGEPGRGVRTIVDMVVHTRLDCVIGSSALMRLGVQHAARHAYCRNAFGKKLIDQPLMRGVLADLAIESEAAVATWLRLARAFDQAHNNDIEGAFVRIATAVSKYYICKRTPSVIYEAMECHGGNGYVAEGPMAKLFLQSPLNSIWEGSGNVICLDVIRALQREPSSARALLGELDGAMGMAAEVSTPNSYCDMVALLHKDLASSPAALEPRARAVVDKLAVCLQGATLLKYGDPTVACAFLATRLPVSDETTHLRNHNFGALGSSLPEEVIDRLIDRVLVTDGVFEAHVGVPPARM